MTYTVAAGLGLVLAVVVDLAVTRTALVATRAFWTTYAIVLTFQLLVNGVLTGLGIVRYRRSTILGPRLAFAPIEDIAFGFALILATLATWVWLERRSVDRPRPPAAAPGPPAVQVQDRPDRLDTPVPLGIGLVPASSPTSTLTRRKSP